MQTYLPGERLTVRRSSSHSQIDNPNTLLCHCILMPRTVDYQEQCVDALLWLRQWYQTGGSDRMPILRHWEFLKQLVMTGRLEM
jgi:hypothetical protein